MPYYVHLPDGRKLLFEDNVPPQQAQYQSFMAMYSTPQPEQKPSSGGGLGSDIAGSVIRGLGQLPELGGNIYGLATGEFDNLATRVGKGIQEYGESFYSPEMRAAQQNIEQAQQAAEGQGLFSELGATAGAYLRNPRALLGTAAEQIPMLAATMGGGLATRAGAAGIRSLAGRQLTKEAAEAAGAGAGTVGAVGTGAVMQGADVAGDTYNEFMKLDQGILERSPAYRGLIESGLKPEDAKRTLALGASREASLFSGLESAATGALIPGVERLPFTKASQAGLIRRVLTGGAQEGLQEALEEGGGKYFSNLAISRVDEQRDLMRGVGSAAAAGALPGAILGGAGHALHRAHPEAPKPRGENPELRAAIDESRSMTQIETPIGNISWNDAYDIYNKRYGDLSKLIPDEYERIAVGNILLAQEIKPIQDKIDALRADLETAPNDAAEKKIEAQIRSLEGNLPSVGKPMRGARTGAKAATEGEINAALTQVRGAKSIYGEPIGPADLQGISGIYSEAIGPTNFERIYGQPAGPVERLRLPAPEPIPTPTKFFWRSDDLGGFDVPIDLSGVAYTAKDGRRFFRATVLNSNQEMSIPADQVHAEPGVHETTEHRTITPTPYQAPAGPDVSTAAERPASFREAFPAEEIVSEQTVPPEDVARRIGGYKIPQEERENLLFEAQQAGVKVPGYYPEVPRKTEWTGESQFAVAPEATQATPEATTEAPTTPPHPVTLKANKVIEDFLSGLEKRGKLGKQSAEELRRNLADRQLNNNQVYAAFLAAEQANNLLPQTADHRLEFVKKLYGNDMKAVVKSGASNVDAVGKLQQVEAQGERIAPKKLPNGTIEQGIIRISLAENMLAVIQETTAHEAYHVLQDYYSKYDPDFRKMIDSKFVATHDIVDANGKPIIGKDNKPVKGMYMSEIDQSIIDKLSKFKAANGESYWNNLTVDVKNLVSQEEAQAYAFAALHDANLRGMPITNLVPAYRRFINFLKNFFSNMKKSLRRDGYKTFADVFGEPRTERFEGKVAPDSGTSISQFSARDMSRYKSLYNQQTNSPEFKKWFGDSKAVDEDGKPIVFYHGTSKDTDFDKFNISKRGAWFTNDPLLSSEYAETNDSQKIVYENGKYVKKHEASRVIPAYLKIENPYTGEYPENYKYASNYAKAQREFFDELKSKGYDGWIMNNGQVAVVFNSPAQIKSAIGNVGTFDESNPRIQYSARDVSQYALRPPAAAGASVLERVTGEHYSKPSIFDRALGKIFGAKQGESFKSAAWRTIVNRTYPVYVLEDLMRSQGKWTGRAVARAMEMALNNTGRIQTLLDHGLIRYNKNTGDVEFVNGSKALRDIFGGRVPDSLKKEFQLYGVALRERDLRKNGKKGFFNITDKEVADTIQKYEAAHPEWKNVAADLQKFNEGLIQFALDTGTIDQKTASKLNSMFYTPYYRQMQTDVDGAPEQVLGPSLTRSLNNPRVFAHPLKGGSEAIGDLYENIIRNADSIIRAGMKNVAMKDASKLLQIANLATPTTHAGTRDERVITFKDNGKPVHFRIDDPVLWSAIGGLPAQQRHGILKAMDRVARFFRDAVTLSPRFMLANLWRGKIVAYAQEGQPLYSNTFSGLVDGLKGGEASRNIAAITGFGGYSYGMGERDVAKNFSRKMRIAGGEASMFDRVMQGINAVQHVSEATEMAERVNIYNRMIAEGKTQGEAAWAAYQFAPFSRSGSGEGGIGAVLHSLMPMIPFLNAKVQGLARIIEGQPGDKRFLGLPKQLMLRGMLITAFSVAAAALARSSDPDAWDKESIQNIMNYDILGYVNGNPITLPRGFEVGTLFGALPVFIVRKFTQERGDDMGKVFREAILNTFGFDPLPPAIKPMIEVAANRNFFRGMPIESLSQQKMPVGARVSPTTSETAKLLSGAINASGVPGLFDAQMSPVKAQHLIEGYLGTVGATLVSIVDNIAGASGLLPSKPIGAFGDPYSIPAIAAQATGVDVFYRSGLNRSDRFVNDFYKLERDVNEIYTFIRDAQKNNDTQSLNRMLEENRIPLSMHKSLNNASDQMSKINQRIDFVRRAGSISMEDKTEELNRLQKLKSNIARQMITQAERIGAIQ